MAIEFFTGFEGCYSTADIFAMGFWEERSDNNCDLQYSATGGFNNSKTARLYGRLGLRLVNNRISAGVTKAMGLHIRNLPIENKNTVAGNDFCCFRDTDNNLFSLHNTPSGVQFYYNHSLKASTTQVLDTNIHHIEFKVFSNATTGYVQVKINGALVIDASSLVLSGLGIDKFGFGMYDGSSRYTYFDNIYVADDFQGELYSYLLKPSTDASVQFTPLSGTDNFAMLQSNDGDTSYVESDTVGHKDLYGYEDLPLGLIPLAASVVTNARKEGTGERTLQIISKQDVTEYDDPDIVTLPIVYPNSYLTPVMLKTNSLAPDGTAWTRDKINAMQWGFKVAG